MSVPVREVKEVRPAPVAVAVDTTAVASLAAEIIDHVAEADVTMNAAVLALISATVFAAARALRHSETPEDVEFNRRELAAVLDRTSVFIKTWNPEQDVQSLAEALRECLPTLH
jgi:hypothetical protein